MKIKDQLTKKLGPLPVWAWGVVGAAGVWVVRNMMASRSPVEETAYDTTGAGLYGSSGSGLTSYGGGALPPVETPSGFGDEIFIGRGDLSFSGSAKGLASLLGSDSPFWALFGSPMPYDGYAPAPAPYSPYAPAAATQTQELLPGTTGSFGGYQATYLGSGGQGQDYGYFEVESPVPFTAYQDFAYYEGYGGIQLSKPIENMLATQEQNCIRIRANPEWYTAAERAACGA